MKRLLERLLDERETDTNHLSGSESYLPVYVEEIEETVKPVKPSIGLLLLSSLGDQKVNKSFDFEMDRTIILQESSLGDQKVNKPSDLEMDRTIILQESSLGDQKVNKPSDFEMDSTLILQESYDKDLIIRMLQHLKEISKRTTGIKRKKIIPVVGGTCTGRSTLAAYLSSSNTDIVIEDERVYFCDGSAKTLHSPPRTLYCKNSYIQGNIAEYFTEICDCPSLEYMDADDLSFASSISFKYFLTRCDSIRSMVVMLDWSMLNTHPDEKCRNITLIDEFLELFEEDDYKSLVFVFNDTTDNTPNVIGSSNEVKNSIIDCFSRRKERTCQYISKNPEQLLIMSICNMENVKRGVFSLIRHSKQVRKEKLTFRGCCGSCYYGMCESFAQYIISFNEMMDDQISMHYTMEYMGKVLSRAEYGTPIPSPFDKSTMSPKQRLLYHHKLVDIIQACLPEEKTDYYMKEKFIFHKDTQQIFERLKVFESKILLDDNYLDLMETIQSFTLNRDMSYELFELCEYMEKMASSLFENDQNILHDFLFIFFYIGKCDIALDLNTMKLCYGKWLDGLLLRGTRVSSFASRERFIKASDIWDFLIESDIFGIWFEEMQDIISENQTFSIYLFLMWLRCVRDIDEKFDRVNENFRDLFLSIFTNELKKNRESRIRKLIETETNNNVNGSLKCLYNPESQSLIRKLIDTKVTDNLDELILSLENLFTNYDFSGEMIIKSLEKMLSKKKFIIFSQKYSGIGEKYRDMERLINIYRKYLLMDDKFEIMDTFAKNGMKIGQMAHCGTWYKSKRLLGLSKKSSEQIESDSKDPFDWVYRKGSDFFTFMTLDSERFPPKKKMTEQGEEEYYFEQDSEQDSEENYYSNELLRACEQGSYKEIEEMLNIEGCDPNSTDESMEHALVIAYRNGYEKIAKLLLCNERIDPYMACRFLSVRGVKNALYIACRDNRKEILEILIRSDRPDPTLMTECMDFSGMESPFSVIIRMGNETCKEIIFSQYEKELSHHDNSSRIALQVKDKTSKYYGNHSLLSVALLRQDIDSIEKLISIQKPKSFSVDETEQIALLFVSLDNNSFSDEINHRLYRLVNALLNYQPSVPWHSARNGSLILKYSALTAKMNLQMGRLESWMMPIIKHHFTIPLLIRHSQQYRQYVNVFESNDEVCKWLSTIGRSTAMKQLHKRPIIPPLIEDDRLSGLLLSISNKPFLQAMENVQIRKLAEAMWEGVGERLTKYLTHQISRIIPETSMQSLAILFLLSESGEMCSVLSSLAIIKIMDEIKEGKRDEKDWVSNIGFLLHFMSEYISLTHQNDENLVYNLYHYIIRLIIYESRRKNQAFVSAYMNDSIFSHIQPYYRELLICNEEDSISELYGKRSGPSIRISLSLPEVGLYHLYNHEPSHDLTCLVRSGTANGQEISTRIYLHKCVIRASSPYLCDLIENDPNSTFNDEIINLIKSCYGHSYEPEGMMPSHLIDMAIRLKFRYFLSARHDIIEINQDNIIRFLELFSDSYEDASFLPIIENIEHFVINNRKTVMVKNKELAKNPFLLHIKDLVFSMEEETFSNQDESTRGKHDEFEPILQIPFSIAKAEPFEPFLLQKEEARNKYTPPTIELIESLKGIMDILSPNEKEKLVEYLIDDEHDKMSIFSIKEDELRERTGLSIDSCSALVTIIGMLKD